MNHFTSWQTLPDITYLWNGVFFDSTYSTINSVPIYILYLYYKYNVWVSDTISFGIYYDFDEAKDIESLRLGFFFHKTHIKRYMISY